MWRLRARAVDPQGRYAQFTTLEAIERYVRERVGRGAPGDTAR